MPRTVATHLMFTGQAAAALELYASVFPSFRIDRVEHYGEDEPARQGTIKRADASFAGHDLVVIDSPPVHAFSFTPSMSLFVECDSREEIDAAFGQLADGGQVLMPLDDYGFSSRFGWCTDRFGVSWQLNLA